MEDDEALKPKDRAIYILKSLHIIPNIFWIVMIVFCIFIAPYMITSHYVSEYPPPKGSGIPATQFSEHRALEYLSMLSLQYSSRATGTTTLSNAMVWTSEYVSNFSTDITSEFQIVELDDYSSNRISSFYIASNGITNLILRLEGNVPDEALLLNAHIDSVPGTAGTMDNGAGVATMIEIFRNLAHEVMISGKFHYSVILLLNGAEEMGLLGAKAFMNDTSLSEKVKGFINIDATGVGKEMVVQNTEKSSNMLKHYIANAPKPVMNSIGNYLISLTGSSTDYEVLSKTIPGIDIVYTGFNFFYHTPRDDLVNYAKGSIQHCGDNLLPAIKAILNDPEAFDGTEFTVSFFDILGQFSIGVIDAFFALLTGITVIVIVFVLGMIYPFLFMICSSILTDKFHQALLEADEKYKSIVNMFLNFSRSGRDVDIKKKRYRIIIFIARMLFSVFLNILFLLSGIVFSTAAAFIFSLWHPFFFISNTYFYVVVFSLLGLLPMIVTIGFFRIAIPRLMPHCLDGVFGSMILMALYSILIMCISPTHAYPFIILDIALAICYMLMNLPFISWAILRGISLLVMIIPLTLLFYPYSIILEIFIPRSAYGMTTFSSLLNSAIASSLLAGPTAVIIGTCSWIFFPADYDLHMNYFKIQRKFELPNVIVRKRKGTEETEMEPLVSIEGSDAEKTKDSDKKSENEEVLSETSSVEDSDHEVKEVKFEEPVEVVVESDESKKEKWSFSTANFILDAYNFFGFFIFVFYKHYKYLCVEFAEVPYKGWKRYGITTSVLMVILIIASAVIAVTISDKIPFSIDKPTIALSIESFYPNGTPGNPDLRYQVGVLLPLGSKDMVLTESTLKDEGDYSLMCEDCTCALPGSIYEEYDERTEICLNHAVVSSSHPDPSMTLVEDLKSTLSIEFSCSGCQSARILTQGCILSISRAGSGVIQQFDSENERNSEHSLLLIGSETLENKILIDFSLCEEKKLDLLMVGSYVDDSYSVAEITRRMPPWTTTYAKQTLSLPTSTSIYGNFTSST